MSHNTIGKQAGYDGTNVEFIAKNLVCETLNGTAVPSGGLSQTLDEVCTGGTNNVTTRQVIANGLVSTNGRVFCQQQPLPTVTQLSNIVTFTVCFPWVRAVNLCRIFVPISMGSSLSS